MRHWLEAASKDLPDYLVENTSEEDGTDVCMTCRRVLYAKQEADRSILLCPGQTSRAPLRNRFLRKRSSSSELMEDAFWTGKRKKHADEIHLRWNALGVDSRRILREGISDQSKGGGIEWLHGLEAFGGWNGFADVPRCPLIVGK